MEASSLLHLRSISQSLPSLPRFLFLFLDAIVDPPLVFSASLPSLDCRRGGVVTYSYYCLLLGCLGVGDEMGRLFCLQLEGKMYSCKHCQTHLALCEDIVSKVLIFFFFFEKEKVLDAFVWVMMGLLTDLYCAVLFVFLQFFVELNCDCRFINYQIGEIFLYFFFKKNVYFTVSVVWLTIAFLQISSLIVDG